MESFWELNEYVQKFKNQDKSEESDAETKDSGYFRALNELDQSDSDAESEEDCEMIIRKPLTKKNNKYVSLRSQYQWIPSQFKIYKNKDVEINGEIHNLPRKNNEELYGLISKVFQEMLPGFQQLGLLDSLQNETDQCNLQVVVKAQKYSVQPGTEYVGKWHLEGKTENIVAVGVYYFQMDPEFNDSQLQLGIIKKEPEEFYDNGIHIQNTVNLQDGTSVVFKNTPHRVDGLYNSNKKKVKERSILSFFIIDPKKPLKDTNYLQNLKDNIIQEYGGEKLEEKLREQGFETDIEIGKQKRSKVRKSVNQEVSGWGYVYYGNEGDTFYLDGFKANLQEDTLYTSFTKQDPENYPFK